MSWPDPTKPGLPVNPEQDGWHWLRYNLHASYTPEPWLWYNWQWQENDGEAVEISKTAYVGPCLAPAEVAALIVAEREALLNFVRQEELRQPNVASAYDPYNAAGGAYEEALEEVAIFIQSRSAAE